MNRHKEIASAVFYAVDEVNQQLVEQPKIEKSLDTRLLGEESNLESLSLISLLVAVEQQISTSLNVNLDLTDITLASASDDHSVEILSSIGTLVDYIDSHLSTHG